MRGQFRSIVISPRMFPRTQGGYAPRIPAAPLNIEQRFHLATYFFSDTHRAHLERAVRVNSDHFFNAKSHSPAHLRWARAYTTLDWNIKVALNFCAFQQTVAS